MESPQGADGVGGDGVADGGVGAEGGEFGGEFGEGGGGDEGDGEEVGEGGWFGGHDWGWVGVGWLWSRRWKSGGELVGLCFFLKF